MIRATNTGSRPQAFRTPAGYVVVKPGEARDIALAIGEVNVAHYAACGVEVVALVEVAPEPGAGVSDEVRAEYERRRADVAELEAEAEKLARTRRRAKPKPSKGEAG